MNTKNLVTLRTQHLSRRRLLFLAEIGRVFLRRVKMEMKEAIRLLNRAKSLLRHAHYNSREFDEHRKHLISSIEDFEERHECTSNKNVKQEWLAISS